jgi:sugar lactone lactonase YvrE
MLIRNEHGSFNPSSLVKICLQFLPSGAGQNSWTFKEDNVLRKPAGIALDQNSNVFVAGNGTNNVVVLSPDGKNCREILTQRNGSYQI